MKDACVAQGFWEKIAQSTRNNEEKRNRKRKFIQQSINLGLDERIYGNSDEFLARIAGKTINRFELGQSRAEQFQILKEQKIQELNGVVKYLPGSAKHVFSYFQSLYVPYTRSEILKNLAISSVFAIIALINEQLRMATMYGFIGNMIMLSILLTRNMPKQRSTPGLESKTAVFWSFPSFLTAVGLIATSTISSVLLSLGALALTKIDLSIKLKISVILSLLSSAVVASCFEVFEPKNRAGWRWKSVRDGYLPSNVEDELMAQLDEREDGVDTYSFDYDFEADGVNLDDASLNKNMDKSEMDAVAAYEKWIANKSDVMKVHVELREDLIGAKSGFFGGDGKATLWSQSRRSSKKTQKESGDSVGQKKVVGPLRFRDKSPYWMQFFRNTVGSNKNKASQVVAREFGTYRKTMWRTDKEVVLQPCDGVQI